MTNFVNPVEVTELSMRATSSCPTEAIGTAKRAEASRLEAVDWTFEHRLKAPKIESIHPYPAKFIGAIPGTFLNCLEIPDGTAVMDPFCGSGTTLLEAQRAGRPSIGVDLNPIACLISRVKTAPVAPGFLDAVLGAVSDAKAARRTETPNIPNLDHWFKKDVQEAVSSLSATLADATYSLWQDQLRLTLSSILVRVSNQDSDTRYAAVEKNLTKEDVYSAFVAAAKKLDTALSSRDWHLGSTQVIEANILDVTSSDIKTPVGLVVTSPPYPNAYEYWLYHKYRMWWLGFDPLAVKEQEIGARAHFFKKNHHTAELFEEQMQSTLSLLEQVLVPGGYVCIVVGRSKIHGKIIDNGSMIYDLGIRLGMTPITKIERQINSTRKSFNLSHANIKTESVLVLKKK